MTESHSHFYLVVSTNFLKVIINFIPILEQAQLDVLSKHMSRSISLQFQNMHPLIF